MFLCHSHREFFDFACPDRLASTLREHQGESTDPIEQASHRHIMLILSYDPSGKESPKRCGDTVSKCFVSCAVGYFLALAGRICVPMIPILISLTYQSPIVLESLQSFTFKSERRKPSHYCALCAYILHTITSLRPFT